MSPFLPLSSLPLLFFFFFLSFLNMLGPVHTSDPHPSDGERANHLCSGLSPPLREQIKSMMMDERLVSVLSSCS